MHKYESTHISNFIGGINMAKQTPAQLKAISKYQSKLDTITFRVPKGEKAKIADFAKSHNMSMTKFIILAIKEKMESEK